MRTAPEMVDLSTGHAVRVAFRTDARSAVGRDHFRRCLALAHALRAFVTESLVLLAGPSGPPGDAGRGRARVRRRPKAAG